MGKVANIISKFKFKCAGNLLGVEMVSPATPDAEEVTGLVVGGVVVAPVTPPAVTGVEVEEGGGGEVNTTGVAEAPPAAPSLAPPTLAAKERRRELAGRSECSAGPVASCPNL